MKLVILIILTLTAGCGVKGNPEPPETPPQLGRGKPTYERATQEMIEAVSSESEDEKAKDVK